MTSSLDLFNPIFTFITTDLPNTTPSLDFGWWEHLLAGLVGILAGFITTLAGLGSAITLYMLIHVIGLPDNMANATNRVGVLSMAMTALPTFHKNGHLNLKKTWPILSTLVVGAIAGVLLVLNVSNEQFRQIFKYLFIFLCIITLVNPKKWIGPTDVEHKINWWWMMPVFFGLGIYAGFIQMGSGVVMLVLLVLGAKLSLLDANGIKLASVSIYTLLVVCIFASQGLIHWGIGLALAAGEAIGAVIATRYVTNHPNATIIMHKVLVFMVISGTLWMFRNEIYSLFT